MKRTELVQCPCGQMFQPIVRGQFKRLRYCSRACYVEYAHEHQVARTLAHHEKRGQPTPEVALRQLDKGTCTSCGGAEVWLYAPDGEPDQQRCYECTKAAYYAGLPSSQPPEEAQAEEATA